MREGEWMEVVGIVVNYANRHVMNQERNKLKRLNKQFQ